MPQYKYTAKDMEGKSVRGSLEAADESAAYKLLKGEGKYPVSLQEKKADDRKEQGKIKTAVLAEFGRQLGTLLDAGVSLVRALHIVSEEEGLPPKYKAVYVKLLDRIRQGIPLSDAMEEQGRAFPPLFINMIRSAEANGNIGQTAKKMAVHYEKEQKLNGKVTNAMIYPAVLSFLLVGVIVFILTYLVPQFQDIFDEMEALPLPTVLLLGMSNGLKQHWPVVIGVVVLLIVAFRVLLRIPAVRIGKDRMKLKLPVVGKLLKKIYTARFARTLSSLYSSGISIVTALRIGSRTIGNSYIESQFEEAVSKIRSGEALSKALSEMDGFQKKLSATILVGEETGSLDEMLESMAESMDDEASRAIEKLVSLLEPVLIIVMGLIIGFVVVAVIMPIYQSYSTIGQGY